MDSFIGRAAELALLAKRFEHVRTSGTGTAVAIRGRRQVGKSRLVQEFCDRSGAPYVFFAATKGASPVEAVAALTYALRASSLPTDREAVAEAAAGSWPDAFRVLAAAIPPSGGIVVVDELPWLAEQDDLFDGALQTAWDRALSGKPVLLLLLGSDLHVMDRLTAYDRPFFGRADNLVLGPLSPAETATATGLAGLEAIDARLVSGGLPGVLRRWPREVATMDFLAAECADPAAPIWGIAESTLLAEFPAPDQSRRVLEAIGGGDRTHATIAASAGSRAGPLPSGTLSPVLRRLTVEKQVLAMDEPLSVQPAKPMLYRIADTHLRFYLAIGRDAQEQALRGRVDAARRVIERRYAAWRGRAIEPLVREALLRAASAGRLPWHDVAAVGGWWNRQFNPEIDLVGADRGPVAGRVDFVGSIKWLDTPFEPRHLAELQAAAVHVPGYIPGTTGLVVVSASGIAPQVERAGVTLVWGPEDVLGTWRDLT